MDRITEINTLIDKLMKEKNRLIEAKNRVHPDEKVHKFLKTYSGQQLLAKHKLDEYGIWNVKGEDPNADLHGDHHQPDLGIFEGKLNDVLVTAVNIRDFWAWGAGGDVEKVVPKKVTKV